MDRDLAELLAREEQQDTPGRVTDDAIGAMPVYGETVSPFAQLPPGLRKH